MYSLNCLYNLQKMLRNYSLFLRLVVLIHTPLCISERFQNNISDRTLAMAVGLATPPLQISRDPRATLTLPGPVECVSLAG